eukprot:gnl/Hemi2/26933_TR9057_c0_g1_i1.p1 gnl/Hemi2/26933_TR9057_c0_g1~~gnl/Hemi2/26933_TR9057_c0_g1_i1.p1  ORF type:complete len:311 (+),score=56.76 gnl/Hemi2/26933_TR9057_c0_g1_i1:171-1103(+)
MTKKTTPGLTFPYNHSIEKTEHHRKNPITKVTRDEPKFPYYYYKGERYERYAALCALFGVVLGAICWYCRVKVPFTDRHHVVFTTPGIENLVGAMMAENVVKQHKDNILSDWHWDTRRVANVANKIIRANNLQDHFDWTCMVIQSSVVNAFVLPGGKIFVFTGLLKLCDSDDELAMVLGHEMGHAVARHGAEHINVAALMGAAALATNLGSGLFSWVMKLLIEFPWSRKLEMEADLIGLRLMANACFQPTSSIYGKLGGANDITKYLSTHPSGQDRVDSLDQHITRVSIPAVCRHGTCFGDFFKGWFGGK